MACLEGLPVTRKAGQPGRGRGCGQGARTGVRSLRVPWGEPRPGNVPRPGCLASRRAAAMCVHSAGGNHTAGNPMRPARQADPFTVLGLPARPGLTDDEVRAAWRRVAAATHPDRADGGDAARFAAAAAAYTAIRTGFGRTEALADLARPAGVRRWKVQVPGLRRYRRARAARREAAGPGPRRWRPAAVGERRRRRPAAGLLAGRWWSRVRGGRPARLALRIAAAAAVSIAVALVAGPQPRHACPHHRSTDLAGRDRPSRPGSAGMTAPCRARVPAGSGCRSAGSAPVPALWTWTRTAAAPAR